MLFHFYKNEKILIDYIERIEDIINSNQYTSIINFSFYIKNYVLHTKYLLKNNELYKAIHSYLCIKNKEKKNKLLYQILKHKKYDDRYNNLINGKEELIYYEEYHKDILLNFLIRDINQSKEFYISFSELENYKIKDIFELIHFLKKLKYHFEIDRENELISIENRNDNNYSYHKEKLILQFKNTKNVLKSIITEEEKIERLKSYEQKRKEILENMQKEYNISLQKNNEMKELENMKIKIKKNMSITKKEELEFEQVEDMNLLFDKVEVIYNKNILKNEKNENEDWRRLNDYSKIIRLKEMENLEKFEEEYFIDIKDLIKNRNTEDRKQWEINQILKKTFQELNIKDYFTMSRVLIIYGLPEISLSKKEKLKTFLQKKIEDISKLKKVNINLIIDNNNVKTFCFFEHLETDKIKKLLNNYKLDKTHTLKCIYKEEVENILSTEDNYTEQDESILEVNNIYDYINEDYLSQFLIHSLDKINLKRNLYQIIEQKKILQEEEYNIKENIKDIIKMNFSNTGIYLYIITSYILSIYVKKNLIFFINYKIKNINSVIFSKNDKYILITNEDNIYLYEICSNKLIKRFYNKETKVLISNNEKYIIHLHNSKIKIYNIQIEKVVFTEENIFILDVSNTSNLLYYIIKYDNTKPSIINFLNIENEVKEIENVQHVYDLVDAKIYWNYKKTLLHIFKTENREMLFIDSKKIELDNKCIDISWFNNENIFYILDNNQNLLIYINNKVKSIKLQKVYKNILANPNEKIIILYNLLYEDTIQLVDINNIIIKNTISYKGCTNVQWDYSGRFFILYSLNSYRIYNFQGYKLYEEGINNIVGIFWRNYPDNIISNNIKHKIKNNIVDYKDYIKTIRKKEEVISNDTSLKNERLKLLNEYRNIEKELNII